MRGSPENSLFAVKKDAKKKENVIPPNFNSRLTDILSIALLSLFVLCLTQRFATCRRRENKDSNMHRHLLFLALSIFVAYACCQWPVPKNPAESISSICRIKDQLSWLALFAPEEGSNLCTPPPTGIKPIFFGNSEVWPQELFLALWQVTLGCF